MDWLKFSVNTYAMKQALLLLLISGLALQVLRAQEESLTVSNLTYTNQVLGNYIYGIEIQFQLDYQAQKTIVKDKEISVFLFDSNNVQVASHALGTTYRNEDNHLRIVSPLPKAGSGVSTHRVFVPYYAIGLLPGTHSLRVVPTIKKLMRDDVREAPVQYKDLNTIVLEMPPLTRIGLQVTDLSVSPKNLDGQDWDASLGISKEATELPDLKYRISFEEVAAKDEVFTSGEVENALQASWAQPTPYFYIGPQDKLTLEILDGDGLKSDNRIGRKTFTLKQLEDLAMQETPGRVAEFDQVVGLTLTLLEQN